MYLVSGLAAISVGPGVLPTLATAPPLTPVVAAITVGLLAGCGWGRVRRVILRWGRRWGAWGISEWEKVCRRHIEIGQILLNNFSWDQPRNLTLKKKLPSNDQWISMHAHKSTAPQRKCPINDYSQWYLASGYLALPIPRSRLNATNFQVFVHILTVNR